MVLGSALKLSFKRPVPPLPIHGIARSGIHKRVEHAMHREQVGWLNANVFADSLVLMRDKPAAVAMKAHFRRRMRDDTLTPMWLDQYKIASWLCDRKKDEKYRQKVAKKERNAKATVHGLAQLKLTGSKKRSRSSDNEAESDERSSAGGTSSSEGSSEDEGCSDSADE